jgi:glucosylceramidase
MKAVVKHLSIFFFIITLMSSCSISEKSEVEVFETSANGNQLTRLIEFEESEVMVDISIFPDQEHQTIVGFGGSFTEASAFLLNQVSKENRDKILEAYFGESGARYSLTRTHMNSCDFSLGNYSYAPVEEDMELTSFP